MHKKPIAIIGMGAVFPKALNLKDFWRLILNGRDAITDVPKSHWSPDEYFDPDRDHADRLYCKRGGFLEATDFDPAEFGIPPNNLDATDTSQLFGLVAASMALENAGYGKSAEFNRERASVILGVTGTQELTIPLASRLSHPRWQKAMQAAGVDEHTAAEVMDLLAQSYVEWQENSFPGLLGNVVAGRISNRLDLRGTNCVVDAACASSLGALHLALLELADGNSDLVVSGGVDTLNDVFMHMCFCKTGVLSPTGDIRPFAADADGTVLGEGIGMLVLKRLEDAERDNDNIYAVIKGLGSSSDGKSQSIYAPNAKGQERALRNAYAAAGIDPATVGLIEGHGTGTLVGDKVEVSALQAVFTGAKPRQTAIGSVKALVGHTKAAAGSAGLIKAALALYNKVLPPSTKIETPNQILNDAASPFYLNTVPRPWVADSEHPRRAGVSAFGFGGSNFHAVLEEYRPQKKQISWDNTTQILAFSADTLPELQAQIHNFQALKLTKFDDMLAWRAMETRRRFKSDHDLRLLVSVDEHADIETLLAQAVEIISQAMPQTTADIYFGHGKPEGALAFVFPGQGSQYPHMGGNYAVRFPQALEALELFNAGFEDARQLSDYIYPQAAFNEDERKAHFAALTQTVIAQPALGAISLGMTEILRHFGVTPAFTIGHSFGELSALYAAGQLSKADFVRMSVARGRAVAEACVQNSPGGMLAVHAAASDVEAFLEQNKLDICIANRNAPMQTVLAGEQAAIQATAELLRKAGYKCTALQVSGAFHSRFVEQASDLFATQTQSCRLVSAPVPVISNVTGASYPEDQAAAQDLLNRQVKSPVDFMQGVASLYDHGVRTFVEVGPKNVLSNLIGNILAEKDIEVLSLDKSKGRNHLQDLSRTLCYLAALGYAVKLDLWEEALPEPRKKIMHVPLYGANFGPKGVTADPHKPKPPVVKNKPLDNRRPPVTAVATPAVAAASASAVMQSYAQNTNTDNKIMNNNTNLNLIEQSLSAIRQLQEQVTRAHEKFLDTQAEANRTLQSMLSVMSGGQAAMPQTVPAQIQAAPMAKPLVTQPAPVQDNVKTVTAAVAPVKAEPIPKAQPATPVTVQAGPDIAGELLKVVSELTGYPADMLQLDMQIESDLGIDSIKRVEILSTLEERVPNLPQTDPEAMAALKTLGEIAAVFSSAATVNTDQPAVTATPAASVTNAAAADVTAGLLAVVSELTGYPADMLQLDMQIESDLGIDSIKRVEILSTLEERLPNLPQTDPEEMAALKTLGEIAAVLSAGQVTSIAADTQLSKPANTDVNADVASALIAVVSELTGYPADMLQPDMQLESDLGIDSIKRVEILSTLEERLPNLPQTDPEAMAALKTLGEIAAVLGATSGKASAQTVAMSGISNDKEPPAPAKTTGIPPQRRVIKVVEVPLSSKANYNFNTEHPVLLGNAQSALMQALANKLQTLGVKTLLLDKAEILQRDFDNLQGLILSSDSEADDNGKDLLLNFEILRHTGPALLQNAKPFVAGISQLDGAFGFKHDRSVNAESAGLAGLLKTLQIEWPGVNCRMLDIDSAWQDTAAQAAVILAELYLTDGLETGLADGKRFKLDLQLTDLPELNTAAFDADDLFVISGGARGVTAEAAIALSRAFKPKLALLGRSPKPFKEPVWLAGLTVQGDIKKAIIANDFKNTTPAPKDVEARFRYYMANREINANLDKMCALGADAKYYNVDILDKAALQTAFTDIKADMGAVTALVHGAGVLEDKLLLGKTGTQFARVYTTKVTGLRNLLAACKNEKLKALALFSSVTARMGNKGQCDYAAANEILNKTAQNMSLEYPGLKAVAFNWGPWDGGMVSLLLKKEFAELKVDLIDMQCGAEAFVREIAGPETDVEVVFGSGFEALLPKIEVPVQAESSPATVSSKTVTDNLHHLFDLEITPETFPVLNDHMIDGNYVMPFAISLELMAHAAIHENPGLKLTGVTNARVYKGLVLPHNDPVAQIGLYAGKATQKAGQTIVAVELRAQQAGRSYTVAGAQIILADKLEKHAAKPPQNALKTYRSTAHQVYDQVLFHGKLLQGLTDIITCDAKGAESLSACSNNPHAFMAYPLRSSFLTEPLTIDCAFQLASLWSFENLKAVSLPGDFGNMQIYGGFKAESEIRIILNVTSVKGQIMKGDFVFCDNENVIAEIKDFSAVINQSLNQAFKPHLKIAV